MSNNNEFNSYVVSGAHVQCDKGNRIATFNATERGVRIGCFTPGSHKDSNEDNFDGIFGLCRSSASTCKYDFTGRDWRDVSEMQFGDYKLDYKKYQKLFLGIKEDIQCILDENGYLDNPEINEMFTNLPTPFFINVKNNDAYTHSLDNNGTYRTNEVWISKVLPQVSNNDLPQGPELNELIEQEYILFKLEKIVKRTYPSIIDKMKKAYLLLKEADKKTGNRLLIEKSKLYCVQGCGSLTFLNNGQNVNPPPYNGLEEPKYVRKAMELSKLLEDNAAKLSSKYYMYSDTGRTVGKNAYEITYFFSSEYDGNSSIVMSVTIRIENWESIRKKLADAYNYQQNISIALSAYGQLGRPYSDSAAFAGDFLGAMSFIDYVYNQLFKKINYQEMDLLECIYDIINGNEYNGKTSAKQTAFRRKHIIPSEEYEENIEKAYYCYVSYATVGPRTFSEGKWR